MKTYYTRRHEFVPSGVDLTETCPWCKSKRTLVNRIVFETAGVNPNRYFSKKYTKCVNRKITELNRVEWLMLKVARVLVSTTLSALVSGLTCLGRMRSLITRFFGSKKPAQLSKPILTSLSPQEMAALANYLEEQKYQQFGGGIKIRHGLEPLLEARDAGSFDREVSRHRSAQ